MLGWLGGWSDAQRDASVQRAHAVILPRHLTKGENEPSFTPPEQFFSLKQLPSAERDKFFVLLGSKVC